MNIAQRTKNRIIFLENRGSLEEHAMKYGYSFNKVSHCSRTELENIMYTTLVLNLDFNKRYRVTELLTDRTVIKECSCKFLIDWIARVCTFGWYDCLLNPIVRRENVEVLVKEVC